MSDTNYLTVMQQAMSVNANFKTEITNIKKEVNSVTNVFQQIPQNIEKSTSALSNAKDASSGLLGAVQQIAGALITMPEDMNPFPNVEGVIEQFNGLQNAVSVSVFTIGESIASAFNLDEKLSAATTAITNFATLIPTLGIGEAFKQAFPVEVQYAIVMIGGAILAGLVPALYAAMVPLLPFIAAGAVLAGLAYLIYSNWQTITEFFSTAWTNAISTVTGLWNEFSAFASELWNQIVETIKGVLDPLIQFLDETWNTISETANTVWNEISTNLSNLWDGIKNTVVNTWNSILTFISGIWEKIKSGFDELVNKAKNWGKNLIDEFIAGIKEKIEAVKEAVLGIANTVKGYIGHESPTKLGPGRDADKWAPNLVEMYADGIKNSLPKLQASLGLMAMSLSSAGMGAGGGVATSYGGIVINIYGADANEVMSQLERKLVRLGVKF